MRIDATSWYYSPGHGQLCQVIRVPDSLGQKGEVVTISVRIQERSTGTRTSGRKGGTEDDARDSEYARFFDV